MLETLSKEELKLVLIRKVKAGQVIYNIGDLCEEICIVEKGEIVISDDGFNGEENIINVIHENEVFGNVLIFTLKPYYIGTIYASKNTILNVIEKDLLNQLLHENVCFMHAYLQSICSETLESKKRIKLLTHKTIKDRILFYVYQHKSIEIKSIASFAKELSFPRESVSRVIHDLMNQGIITYEKKRIALK